MDQNSFASMRCQVGCRLASFSTSDASSVAIRRIASCHHATLLSVDSAEKSSMSLADAEPGCVATLVSRVPTQAHRMK